MPVLDQVNAYKIANSSMKDQMNLCYNLAQNISNAERMNYRCPSVEYSLMTDIYDGAIGEWSFYISVYLYVIFLQGKLRQTRLPAYCLLCKENLPREIFAINHWNELLYTEVFAVNVDEMECHVMD